MKKTVTFNEENHTYNMMWVRNGEECSKHLSGITGLLSKHLFPNKYIGVSEDVLMAAAAKGSAIHKALQVYVSTGFVLERYEELCKNFDDFCEVNSITPTESEFLVTDEEELATMIDMIDDNGNYYDFKTTYTLDKSYLSWQLSMGAYLGRQDKTKKLFAIHIRENNFELIDVDRIPDDKIEKLMESEANGTLYKDDAVATIDTEALVLLEQTFISLKIQMEDIEEKRKALSELIRVQMQEKGIKSFEAGNLLLTDVADTSATTFDSKKFKAENPDLAGKYEKTSNRKGYLKITFKK